MVFGPHVKNFISNVKFTEVIRRQILMLLFLGTGIPVPQIPKNEGKISISVPWNVYGLIIW